MNTADQGTGPQQNESGPFADKLSSPVADKRVGTGWRDSAFVSIDGTRSREMTKRELAQLFLDYLERQDEQRLNVSRVPKSRRSARLTFWLHNNMTKGKRVIDVSELRKLAK